MRRTGYVSQRGQGTPARSVTTLAAVCIGAVLYGCAFFVPAGAAAAGLTVEIIKPTTAARYSFVTGREYDFETVAWAEGAELPGGEVSWEWDFGDDSEHVLQNPTHHTFAASGNWTVTVTARYNGLSGQGTLNAAALPEGAAAAVEVVTSPDTGGEVCDTVQVMCCASMADLNAAGCVFLSATFYRMEDAEWVCVGTPATEVRLVGAAWYWVCGVPWDTTGYPNTEAVQWRIDYTVEAPPPEGEEGPWVVTDSIEASWTPHNTVLTGDDGCLIVHHKGDTSHTVRFNIDHLRDVTGGIDPRYTVVLTVSDLQGNEVDEVTATDVPVGGGGIVWEPQFAGRAGDGNAVYTYHLSADHGACGDDWPSSQTGFSEQPDLGDLGYNQRDGTLTGTVDWQISREPGDVTIVVYPPNLGDPTKIDAGGVQDPEDGYPISVPVPADRHGDYIVIVQPVDSDETGGANRGGQGKPGPPRGGIVPVVPSSYIFRGMGSLLPSTIAMCTYAQQQQARTQTDGFYKAPGYACEYYDANYALALHTYNRLQGKNEEGATVTTRDALILCVGHGDPGRLYIQGPEKAGWCELRSWGGANDEGRDLYYLPNASAGALNRCMLVLLVACWTATPEGDHPSVAAAFKSLGAGCTIGSNRHIEDEESHAFCDAFWLKAMGDGATAAVALNYAAEESDMTDAWEIEGSTPPLRPARYK